MYCIYMYLKEETILAALFQQCSTKENMHTGSNSIDRDTMMSKKKSK